MKIIVVMATYNGGKFIEEQIRSIQRQTIENWTLLIRDDGSDDNTVDIIRRMANADSRIVLLQDKCGNLGVVQNFSHLMQMAEAFGADYVAMSDQDDYWEKEKLQVLFNKIKEAESIGHAGIPMLAHSDLEVVDDAMCNISPSFMDYAGISPEPLNFGHLICQNDVTGCACMINRSLLQLSLPVPDVAPMHDWWLALLASSCGGVVYVKTPLVRYRQHIGNVVGAESNWIRAVRFLINPAKWREQAERVHLSIRQAGELIQRTKDRDVAVLDQKKLMVIEAYAKLSDKSFLKRLNVLRIYAIHKRSLIADIFFQLVVLSIPLRKQQ